MWDFKVDFFVVVNFVATCDKIEHPSFVREIIEFPAVLVSYKERSVVDVFHSFVKPSKNSLISEYCQNSTGISQRMIDMASKFQVVHDNFLAWMLKHHLGTKYTYILVTDGPFSIAKYLYVQTRIMGIPFPYEYAAAWANLKKCFQNFQNNTCYEGNKARNSAIMFYRPNREFSGPRIQEMLKKQGMEFEGNPNQGLDVSKNIARVLIALIENGSTIIANEKIFLLQNQKMLKTANELSNVLAMDKKEAEKWIRAQERAVQFRGFRLP